MNSQQRRKLRRKLACRNCQHSDYHCPVSGCNGRDEIINDWCDCQDFEPLYLKYKIFKRNGS